MLLSPTGHGLLRPLCGLSPLATGPILGLQEPLVLPLQLLFEHHLPYAFTLLVSGAVGVAVGLVPAMRLRRGDLHASVQQGSRRPTGHHDGWRAGLVVWRWLNFHPGTFQPRSDQSAEWNRGAYLTTALGHCAECHTPRNWLGGLKTKMAYAGSADGPEGELAPNITPDEATGIGKWSVADIVWFLQTGLKPDGDDTQGLMSVVIENGYKHLPEADLRAIAVYLRSLSPIRHKVVKKDK